MTDPVGQAAVDRALDEKNLVLVYQPIHDARTKEIVAAEALLRQRRETGEIREAAIITETAEQTSDLFALSSWTMHTAYSDAARWQSGLAPGVRLNVNLSPREFQEGDVLTRLDSLVLQCRIDLHKVNLEITETSFIRKPKDTKHVLSALKESGISLWLDDFGSGHSSLEHLQFFPVDGLKIPSVFVKHLADDHRSQTISRSIVRLAHDLGMKVIAEGVEHRTQLDFLLEAGCDWIQGFLFSRPMPLDEFLAMLGGTKAAR